MRKPLHLACALVLALLVNVFSVQVLHAAPAAAESAVEAEHHAKDAHAVAEGHGKKSGLPQLDPTHFPGQAFWFFLTFILTYVLMKNFAVPLVEKTIDDREKRISADIGGSKAKNEAAKHLMAEYEARLAKARADAQNATRAVSEDASKKAVAATSAQNAKVTADIQAADARILEQKNKAIETLDKEVVGVVVALVQSVAGITPNNNDIETALKKARSAG